MENHQNRTKSQSFANKDLRGQEFQDCVFEQCDFSYANLTNASLENVTFLGCNLSCINLISTRFREVKFAGCKLVGVDFHHCVGVLGSMQLSFSECILNGCNFSDLKLSKTPFLRSQLENCIFTNADLSESDFSKTDLTNTLFHGCQLQKSNFTLAKNYTIDPQNNFLAKAKFALPEAASLLQFLGIELIG